MIWVLLLLMLVVTSVNLFLLKNNRKVKTLVSKAESTIEELELSLEKDEQSIMSLKAKCRSNAVLSALVNQSPNAIMLMDRDGNIIGINKGFVDMYEYDFKEFTDALGTNYRQTSFSPNVQHRLDTIAITKKPIRYEALNITRTGKEIWTQTALMPILDIDGNITNLVTIDTDIHQRVTQSDRLVSEIDELNGKVDALSDRFSRVEGTFADLFESISELYGWVVQTNQILKFIKDISDKTKILGLNASIEASRAGEFGAGFRVITNEIIEISESTIQSVAQIKGIIGSIIHKQDELIDRRNVSEKQMDDLKNMFSVLKQELTNVEIAVSEFKSLA